MKSMITFVLFCFLGGCAAEIAPEDPVAFASEALQRSGGLGAQECSGGTSPRCMACDGVTCVTACSGGYTCEIERRPDGSARSCGFETDSCRSSSFAIGGGRRTVIH